MNYCCKNCGWSEIVGSSIMCNYNGHRTWHDECCEAWKLKEKETNMVEVVRCNNCLLRYTNKCVLHDQAFPINKGDNWFCADGKRREENEIDRC